MTGRQKWVIRDRRTGAQALPFVFGTRGAAERAIDRAHYANGFEVPDAAWYDAWPLESE